MDTPHLRVAMMTNNLIQVDVQFAVAKRVMIYDVNAEKSEFVDTCYFGYGSKKAVEMGKKGPGGGRGCAMDDMGDDDGSGIDPLTERVNALAGCSLLFTRGLGSSGLSRPRAEDLSGSDGTSPLHRRSDRSGEEAAADEYAAALGSPLNA